MYGSFVFILSILFFNVKGKGKEKRKYLELLDKEYMDRNHPLRTRGQLQRTNRTDRETQLRHNGRVGTKC